MLDKTAIVFLFLRLGGDAARMIDRDAGLSRYLLLQSKLALRFILHRIILSTTSAIERIRFYKNGHSNGLLKEGWKE